MFFSKLSPQSKTDVGAGVCPLKRRRHFGDSECVCFYIENERVEGLYGDAAMAARLMLLEWLAS